MKKMNLIKSLGIASIFIFSLTVFLPEYASASPAVVPPRTDNAGVTLVEDNTRQVGVLPSTELFQNQNLLQTIQLVINWALGFMGVVVFGIFLFAGFEYATAGGDSSKTENAQKRMTNAVIGMVILFFAFTASNTILTFIFGNTETTGL